MDATRCSTCGQPMADGGAPLPGLLAADPGDRSCASCHRKWGEVLSQFDDEPQGLHPGQVIPTSSPSESCPDCGAQAFDRYGACSNAACTSHDLFRPRTLPFRLENPTPATFTHL